MNETVLHSDNENKSRSILFCGEYVSLTTHSAPPLRRSARSAMTAPRYRTIYGMGLTCNDIYRIGDALVQYDASGNPVVTNDPNRVPYYKCPNLGNPTAGMATSTNNTNITKKMRYAQDIRVATGKTVTLADEKAMSRLTSPFRRVDLLAEYVVEITRS